MALNGHTNSPQHSGMKRSSSSEPPRANKRPSSSEGTPKVTSTSVGQTAPRLIATIKSADRQHRVENERNPYIHPPRGFDEEFDTSRRQPLYTPCKHYWTTQRSQTILPDHEIATPAQAYRLACFCQQCLWHVDIELQHTAQPCPKEGYPLHHFTNFIRENEHQEWYQARCSGCAATLYIHYRQPRLRAEQIDAMTNTERLAQRLNKAKKNDPDRGHARPAAPIEVLDAMATYLKDALSADALSTEGEKKIPKLNRRFVTSFGEECKDLLVSLGFKDVGEFWTLPRPEPPDPWAWNLRKQLEDTQEELWALMRSLKEHEPGLEIEGRKGYNGNMEPFEEDVQLFLSTMEYDKSKTTRRTPSLTLDEQSWYAGLGCLGDMSDGLIAFGYDRQVATDAGNRAYYFDCLSAIAKKRNSESLDMKMALLASEGAYGRRDVMDAYKYFVLSPHDDDLTDAHIRGVFESRMENIPKAGQTEAREKLRLIGLARGSQALQEAASNELTDHHSALRFLDNTYADGEERPDDYVIALAGAKRAENDSSSHQDQVTKAVQLIANHRDSAVLRAYLATGEATTADDDELAAAYRFFNITDRTGIIEFEVLYSSLNVYEPDQQPRALKYFELLKANHQETAPVKMAPDYTKPVGLANTRNYCYLHALLQYFNSIQPFRDTVLNFEESFKQPVDESDEVELGKLAGKYTITNEHVKDGQNLVPHLTRLFKRLESAPGPDITPSEDLAEEALKTPPSNLPKVAGNVVQDHKTPHSDTSDDTLIGDVLTPASDTVVGDGEAGDEEKSEQTEKPSPPNHPPPPVPPRPAALTSAHAREESYRQQDAHEVLAKMVQRTIGAIRPISIDEHGERHDPLSDLFYAVTQFVSTEDRADPNKFQPSAEINLFLHMDQRPRDVQEALDISFGKSRTSDDDDDSSAARYSVITRPPPILQLYINHYTVEEQESQIFRPKRVPNTMQLSESIYLDRYMENAQHAVLDVRQQSWALRDRLVALENERDALVVKGVKTQDTNVNKETTEDVDIGDALGALIKAMAEESKESSTNTDSTAQLTQELQNLSEEETAKLAQIKEEIPSVRTALDALPINEADTEELRYRLFAVFMYNGTGSAGHWWIHIRDFKNNCWRTYNDSRVSVISESEVLKQPNATGEHSPLVAYVRDDLKELYIDPLHRIKPVGEDGEEIDTAMGGLNGEGGVKISSSGWPEPQVQVGEVEDVEMKSLLDD